MRATGYSEPNNKKPQNIVLRFYIFTSEVNTLKKATRNSICILLVTMMFFCVLGVSAQTYPTPQINLTAPRAYVVNLDSGNIVFSKNENDRASIASTTKIMTAILTIENISDLSQQITVSQDAITRVPANSSLAYLAVGEVLSYDYILSLLMVPSGNDAANTLAVAVGGTYENFIDMMNKKAAELGLTNTHFVNPHGFDEQGHYSSAKDMATLTAYAIKNPEFLKHFTMQTISVPSTNMMPARKFTSTCPNFSPTSSSFSPLIHGAKTGYTSDAGRCLISYVVCDTGSYISVLLGCPTGSIENTTYSSFETKTISDLLNTNYKVEGFGSKTLSPAKVPVKNMSGANEVNLYMENEVFGLFGIGENTSGVSSKISDLTNLTAPIKSGTVAGKITYYLGDEIVGYSNLITTSDIEQSTVKTIANNIISFFSYTWYIFVIVLAFAFFYIGEVLLPGKKRKKKN